MGEIIIMPKQGLQMTEGMITSWLVSEGQEIKEGEPLFEMETDKLAITIDAPCSGTLLKILCQEDEIAEVASPIAVVGEPGENYEDILSGASGAAASSAENKAPADIEDPAGSTAGAADSASEPAAEVPAAKSSPEASQERIFSSPRARTTAQEKGIDYRTLEGSGPDGLIIERDVLKAAAQAAPAKETKENTGDTRQIPISNMRRIIARRMLDSLGTLAQACHRLTVDMSEAVRLREQLKARDIKVSYNDIVIRCTAKALTEFPMMNSTMDDAFITVRDYVNIGVAVATEQGLLVPVIQNAHTLSLPEIAGRSQDLSSRAKENRLMPDELSGGTFTISNLGMYDIESFTAIINKPEAGILAVGKMEKKPAVRNDELVIRPLMQLSLTYDHRIVDGAPAALFLRRIKELLENPGLLL